MRQGSGANGDGCLQKLPVDTNSMAIHPGRQAVSWDIPRREARRNTVPMAGAHARAEIVLSCTQRTGSSPGRIFACRSQRRLSKQVSRRQIVGGNAGQEHEKDHHIMRWSFLAHRGTRCHQAIGGAKSTRQIAPFGSPNQQLVHGIKRLAIVEKRESKSGVF